MGGEGTPITSDEVQQRGLHKSRFCKDFEVSVYCVQFSVAALDGDWPATASRLRTVTRT